MSTTATTTTGSGSGPYWLTDKGRAALHAIPTPGSPAAIRGTLPTVERVVDHEVQTVKLDWASPELGADILKALRDNPDLLERVNRAVHYGHGFLLAGVAQALTQALSKAGATDWTLNPDDAHRLAENLDEAAFELDQCARSGCVWLAEDGAYCTAHAEVTR